MDKGPLGGRGLIEQITDFLSFKHDVPPSPPEPHVWPVVDSPLSAPPYPEMVPESPARKQDEWYIVPLSVAQPAATVRVRTRPAFWVCYLRNPATAGDGVWIEPGSDVANAPVVTAPNVQQSPAWLSGVGSLILHAPEQFISFRFVGTGPVEVMVQAGTGVPPSRQS